MNEETSRKGWAILAASKVARLIPYAVDIAFIFACMGLVILGTQMFKDAISELRELIDAGKLPDCLLYYPSSIMLMLMGLILFLFWLTRRK